LLLIADRDSWISASTLPFFVARHTPYLLDGCFLFYLPAHPSLEGGKLLFERLVLSGRPALTCLLSEGGQPGIAAPGLSPPGPGLAPPPRGVFSPGTCISRWAGLCASTFPYEAYILHFFFRALFLLQSSFSLGAEESFSGVPPFFPPVAIVYWSPRQRVLS